MQDVRYLMTGDTSVSVEFGNEISTEINARIRAFNIALEKKGVPGIVETVPTYRSLTVHYRPEVIRFEALREAMSGLMDSLADIEIPPASVVEIPVLYGGEVGPDLDFVAKHNSKTIEEVIKIHSEPEYLIYMLGFTPGFPYLGGMSSDIAAPRLTSPRVKIPGGSVGIAGTQTGVYPIDSPGGWQLIGQTPLKLYDSQRETPILLQAGQFIKFRPIDKAEFDAIAEQVAKGSFAIKTYSKEG